MGIFSFMSKNGKGCFAAIGKDELSYVVRQITSFLSFFFFSFFKVRSPLLIHFSLFLFSLLI